MRRDALAVYWSTWSAARVARVAAGCINNTQRQAVSPVQTPPPPPQLPPPPPVSAALPALPSPAELLQQLPTCGNRHCLASLVAMAQSSLLQLHQQQAVGAGAALPEMSAAPSITSGVPAPAAQLLVCGGCGLVRYCCRQCQRAHWREGHKEDCAQLAAWAQPHLSY